MRRRRGPPRHRISRMSYECSITVSGDDGRAVDRRRRRWRLLAALGITLVFFVVELVGGIVANSLALIADAGHMLADSTSLIICVAAATLADRRGGARRTWGFYRVEILAALANGLILLFLAAQICYGAVRRIWTPAEVEGLTMLVIAAIGLGANLAGMWLLGGHAHDLNVKGAVLHMLGDTLSSVGVIGGGLLIYLLGWTFVDPILGVVIAGVIAWNAVRLIREAVHILLEGVPPGLVLGDIEAAVAAVPGVKGVHDLHVWSITSGLDALSAHVVVDPCSTGEGDAILRAVNAALKERFGITHATIQLETAGYHAGEPRECGPGHAALHDHDHHGH